METTFAIDHIVIMVDDLAVAVEAYKALGFTVLEGGTHQDNPTHNALVVFEDGVYLELIALRPGATTPMTPRLQRWVQAGPGLVDMALLPADIESAIAAGRARGLAIEDAEAGGRLRPDGQEIAWQTANLGGAGLPFFCADVTPRALRVPEGKVRQHANGALGVAEVTVAVADLALSSGKYQALLGIEPQAEVRPSIKAAKTTAFSLRGSTLILAQPDGDTSPLHDYLVAGGERPYSFTLRTAYPTEAGTLDLDQTQRARITLVAA